MKNSAWALSVSLQHRVAQSDVCGGAPSCAVGVIGGGGGGGVFIHDRC